MPATGKIFVDKLVKLAQKLYRGDIEAGDGPCEFFVDRTVTAAQLIAGPVTLINDSDVPSGYKLYVTELTIRWGATAFATATDVRVSDTNSTPVDFVTVLVANTTGVTSWPIDETGVTWGSALNSRTGATAGKGLRVRTTGSTPTSGSSFIVTVKGYIAP